MRRMVGQVCQAATFLIYFIWSTYNRLVDVCWSMSVPPRQVFQRSSDICSSCFVGKWTAQNGSASCIGCDAPRGYVCLTGPASREGVKCASHLMCPGGAYGDMPVTVICVGSEWHNVCVLKCIETLIIQTMRAYIHTHTHTSISTYRIKIAGEFFICFLAKYFSSPKYVLAVPRYLLHGD